MNAPNLETPAGLKSRLSVRAERLILDALDAESTGEHPVATLKLAPSKLTRAAGPDAIGRIGPWLETWRAGDGCSYRLECAPKSFRLARDLSCPKAIHFDTPEALASFFGEGHPEKLRGLRQALDEIESMDLPSPGDRKARREIYRAAPEDRQALLALMAWRSAQSPDTLGTIALREIPVTRLHTKWVERNAGLVLSAFQDLGWLFSDEGDLSHRLGLARRERGEIWIRLNPAQCGVAGQRQRMGFAADDCAQAPVGVHKVLIVENRTTFDRIAVPEGASLVYGSGNAILSFAPKMPWLRDVSHLLYWGDCDGAGYFILDRLRAQLPAVRSLMMDEACVLTWLDQAGAEKPSEAVSGEMPNLTGPEATGRARLQDDSSRLEQEFIPIPWAQARVDSALNAAVAQDPGLPSAEGRPPPR